MAKFEDLLAGDQEYSDAMSRAKQARKFNRGNEERAANNAVNRREKQLLRDAQRAEREAEREARENQRNAERAAHVENEANRKNYDKQAIAWFTTPDGRHIPISAPSGQGHLRKWDNSGVLWDEGDGAAYRLGEEGKLEDAWKAPVIKKQGDSVYATGPGLPWKWLGYNKEEIKPDGALLTELNEKTARMNAAVREAQGEQSALTRDISSDEKLLRELKTAAKTSADADGSLAKQISELEGGIAAKRERQAQAELDVYRTKAEATSWRKERDAAIDANLTEKRAKAVNAVELTNTARLPDASTRLGLNALSPAPVIEKTLDPTADIIDRYMTGAAQALSDQTVRITGGLEAHAKAAAEASTAPDVLNSMMSGAIDKAFFEDRKVRAKAEGGEIRMPKDFANLTGLTHFPDTWATPEAAERRLTAKLAGQDKIIVPEGVRIEGGKIYSDSGQMGTLQFDEYGVPAYVLDRGAVSPSAKIGDYFRGVAEYRTPEIPAGLPEASIDRWKAEAAANRWGASETRDFIDKWQNANDAERAELIAQIDPRQASINPSDRKLDAGQLYQSGQISAQDARLLNNIAYGIQPNMPDVKSAFETWANSSEAPEAAALRSAKAGTMSWWDFLTTGDVLTNTLKSREASNNLLQSSQNAKRAFLSEFYQTYSRQPDFDQAGFVKARDEVLGNEPWSLRAGAWVDNAITNAVGSSAGMLWGLGRLGLAVAGDIGGAVVGRKGGGDAIGGLTWKEQKLITDQTKLSAKSLVQNIAERLFLPSLDGQTFKKLWYGKNYTPLRSETDALFAKIESGNGISTEELADYGRRIGDFSAISTRDDGMRTDANPAIPGSRASVALAAYVQTLDPSYRDQFLSIVTQSRKSSEVNQAVSDYASDHGIISSSSFKGQLQSSFRGGMVAPLTETAIEVASDLFSAGMAHVLVGGAKWASRADKAGSALSFAQRAFDRVEKATNWWTDLGVVEGKLGRNAALQLGKQTIFEAGKEGSEEWLSAWSQQGTTPDEAFSQAMMGAVGGISMAPAFHASGYATQGVKTVLTKARDNLATSEFVSRWNDAHPEQPINAEQARQARGYHNNELTPILSNTLSNLYKQRVEQSRQLSHLKSKGSEPTPEFAEEIAKTNNAIASTLLDLNVQAQNSVAVVQEIGGLPKGGYREVIDAAARVAAGTTITPQQKQLLLAAHTKAEKPAAYIHKDRIILTDTFREEAATVAPTTARLMFNTPEAEQVERVETATRKADPKTLNVDSPQPSGEISQDSQQQDGAEAARRAHNAEVEGSSPSPASTTSLADASIPEEDSSESVGKDYEFDVVHTPKGSTKNVSSTIQVEAATPEEAITKRDSHLKALRRQGQIVSVSDVRLRDTKAVAKTPEGVIDPALPQAQASTPGNRAYVPSSDAMNWKPAALKSALLNGAAAFGYKIVDTGIPSGSVDTWGKAVNIGTAWYDKMHPGSEIGQWIDGLANTNPEAHAYIAQHTTSIGLHRVWFGHDFASNLSTIVDKFGWERVPEYIGQLLKDWLTKSGIPFPGVQLLVQSGAVSDRVATDWLSANIGEVFGSGLAFFGTYRLLRTSKNGSLTKPRVVFATVGIGLKLVSGVMTAQPFLILSGLADAAILVTNLDQIKAAFQKGIEVAKTNPSPAAVEEQNSKQSSTQTTELPTKLSAQAPGTIEAARPKKKKAQNLEKIVESTTSDGNTPPIQSPFAGTITDSKVSGALQEVAPWVFADQTALPVVIADRLLLSPDGTKVVASRGKTLKGWKPYSSAMAYLDGKIWIDTTKLAQQLDTTNEADRRALLERIIDEEVEHAATAKAILPDDVRALWNEAPEVAKQKVIEAYFTDQLSASDGNWKDAAKGIDSYGAGMEFLRMYRQALKDGATSEQVAIKHQVDTYAVTNPTFAERISKALADIARWLREELPKVITDGAYRSRLDGTISEIEVARAELEAAIASSEKDTKPIVSTETPLPPELFREFGIPLQNAILLPPIGVKAYHGTPHKVDRFSTEKIGTGEGVQAYGWGLYFAENISVANQYQRDLAGELFVDGKAIRRNNQRVGTTGDVTLDDLLSANDGDIDKAIKAAHEGFEEYIPKLEALRGRVVFNNPGNLYAVELDVDPNELLDWDKPLSEQGELGGKVAQAVRVNPSYDGRQAYQILADELGQTYPRGRTGAPKASQKLSLLGIPGIRYLDQDSRDKGAGTYNYVIFDDSKIKILAENGKEISPMDFVEQGVSPVGSKQADLPYNAALILGNLSLSNQLATRLGTKLPAAVADQESRIGLIIAAQRFDASRGVPFEKFATTVIRKRLASARGSSASLDSILDTLQGDPAAIREAVSQLSDRARAALEGFITGRTWQSISAELKLTPTAAEKIAAASFQVLSKQLENRGVTGFAEAIEAAKAPTTNPLAEEIAQRLAAGENPTIEYIFRPDEEVAVGAERQRQVLAITAEYAGDSRVSINYVLDDGQGDPVEIPLESIARGGVHHYSESGVAKDNLGPVAAKPSSSRDFSEVVNEIERDSTLLGRAEDTPPSGKLLSETLGSEAWIAYQKLFRGRLDGADALAPGARKAIEDSQRELTLATLSINAVVDELRSTLRNSFGSPAFWSANRKRMKQAINKLLPTASFLEVGGIGKDGEFIFKRFDRRIGLIKSKDVLRRKLQPGDRFSREDGVVLKIGDFIPDENAFQLLESVEPERQQEIYDAFAAEFPEAMGVLDRWIIPSGSGSVEGVSGIKTVEFNKYALLDLFNSWPDELKNEFGDLPLGEIKGISGYTPDVAAQRSIISMIAALLGKYKSPGHKYKSGSLREFGDVKNLMDGFSTRAMEAHREKIRLKMRQRIIESAVLYEDQVPADMISEPGKTDRQYVRLDDAFSKITEASDLVRYLQRKEFPNLTGALNPQDQIKLAKIVGEVAKLKGLNRVIPTVIHRELMLSVSRQAAEGILLRALNYFLRGAKLGVLTAGSFGVNWIGNQLLLGTRGLNQTLFGLISLATGDIRSARTGLGEASFILRGLLTDRLPNVLNKNRIASIIPRELFDDTTALASLDAGQSYGNLVDDFKRHGVIGGVATGLAKSFMQGGISASILYAQNYSGGDAAVKQQMSYAAYRARAEIAADEAKIKGLARRDWMRNWIKENVHSGSALHEEVMAAANLFAMNYSDVPAWMDPTASLPDERAIKFLKEHGLWFIKWPFNMLRLMKRLGVSGALDVLNPKSTRQQRAQGLAGLLTLASIAFGGKFLLTPSGDDGDDPIVGSRMDSEGTLQDKNLDTSSRINVSALARRTRLFSIIGTALRMAGVDLNENFSTGKGEDWWMYSKNITWIPEAMIAGHALNGDWRNFIKDGGSYISDMAAFGILVRATGLTMTGGMDAKKELPNVLTEVGWQVISSPLNPAAITRYASYIADPVVRRSVDSAALGYDQNPTTTLEGLIPGLTKNLPAAGKVITTQFALPERGVRPASNTNLRDLFFNMGADINQFNMSGQANRDVAADLEALRQKGVGPESIRVFNKQTKGGITRAYISYPDPATVATRDKGASIFKILSGLNFKPVPRLKKEEMEPIPQKQPPLIAGASRVTAKDFFRK